MYGSGNVIIDNESPKKKFRKPIPKKEMCPSRSIRRRNEP